MKSNLKMDVVGATDTGLVRKLNEDFIGWDDNGYLAVLADGMGGHSAGDVASKMAVEGILREFQKKSNFGVVKVDSISRLVDLVNDDIFRLSQEDPNISTMGATLAMTWLNEEKVAVVHAGDSRVYRFHNGILEQVTQDHSLVRQLIEQGTISKVDAKTSRYKNVITRALGVRLGCEAEINQIPAQVGDVFLLCSDGLSNMVSDEVLKNTLDKFVNDWANAAQFLVDEANRAGGDDNISVVLAVVKSR